MRWVEAQLCTGCRELIVGGRVEVCPTCGGTMLREAKAVRDRDGRVDPRTVVLRSGSPRTT